MPDVLSILNGSVEDSGISRTTACLHWLSYIYIYIYAEMAIQNATQQMLQCLRARLRMVS